MVHRTADARLLAGVLSAEGNHTKALTQLLDASATALAALSAYASAGSGPVSRAALAVTGHLRAADNALGKYAQACENWRPELVELKDVEEDVSSILRDRDILVTRLLKASNSSKPRPTSVTSPTASMTSIAGVGPKLAAAQTELQACEQALAAREAELDALRIKVVRDGLKARCKALVECAWTWGEMGKEGLRALEDSGPNGHVISPKYELPNEFFKPLPEGNLASNRPSSDLSITPSLSASQTAVFSDTTVNPTVNPSYQITIPPPHAIGEQPLPPPKATVALRPTLDDKRRVSVVREEDEPEETPDERTADHSDSEPTEEGPVQVVENDRFKNWKAPTASTSDSGIAAKRSQTFPRLKLPSSSSNKANSAISNNIKHATPPTSPTKDRERRASNGPVGFFGKLFGRGSPKKKKAEEEGRWHTRTNANIGKARSRRDSASSDDSATPTGSRTVIVENRNRGNPWAELRAANAGAMDSPASEGRPVGRRLSKRRAELGADGRGGSAVHIPASPGLAPLVGHQRARSASAEPRRTNTLVESRSSPATYAPRPTTPTPSTAPLGTTKTSKHGRRTQSVDLGRPAPAPTVPTPAPKPAPPERRLSNSSARPSLAASTSSKAAKHSSLPPAPSTSAEPPSLMSIVNGLSRQNREGWSSPASSSPLATARPLDPSPNITSAAPSRSNSKKYKRASLDVVPAHRSEGSGSGLGRSSSVRSGSGSNDDSLLGMHHPRKDAKPLKSALRQSSRTPSPMPPMDLIASPLEIGGLKTLGPPPDRHEIADEVLETPRTTVERPVVRSGVVEREDLAEDGGVESDSVESYETGHEDFEDTESPPTAAAPLPAPATVVPLSSLHVPTNGTGHGPASDVSSGGSTAVGPPHVPPKDNDGRPVRRKSVRMSLTPQFAPTPPAVEGEGEMDWEHERDKDAQPKRRNSTEKRREKAREKERAEAAEQERVQALEKEKEILAAQERERVRKQNDQEMGWKMRQHDKGPDRDLWADSSEDGGSDTSEEYKTARSMLLKAGKV